MDGYSDRMTCQEMTALNVWIQTERLVTRDYFEWMGFDRIVCQEMTGLNALVDSGRFIGQEMTTLNGWILTEWLVMKCLL